MTAPRAKMAQDQAGSQPASRHFAITPTDGLDMNICTRGLYVGVGGDVAIVDRGGTSLVYKNAQAGSVIPIEASQVSATGTTATNLIGMI